MNILPIGLGLLAVLIIAEVVLSATWNRFYFTRGVPIFLRRIERAQNLDTLPLETLEKASRTAAGAPFVFRRLTQDAVAFRERPLGGMIQYFPLMRGLIRYKPEEAAVVMFGFVNWTFVVLVAFLVVWLGRNIKDVALWVGGALAVLYFIQAVRYSRVAKAIRNDKGPKS